VEQLLEDIEHRKDSGAGIDAAVAHGGFAHFAAAPAPLFYNSDL
jgi:hypothetical protein